MRTAIDLFAGVGGLSLGFEQAGFKIVWANEFNKSIADAYKKNHPYTIVDSRDIRDINIQEEFKKYIGNIKSNLKMASSQISLNLNDWA